MSNNSLLQEADDAFIRPPEEWEQDIALLAKKIMKIVTGYER
jgi:hypothetical protein